MTPRNEMPAMNHQPRRKASSSATLWAAAVPRTATERGDAEGQAGLADHVDDRGAGRE